MKLAARLRSRARILRAAGVTLLQTAVAAGIAWYLAHDVLGHRSAFFAPVAAVIALGLSPGGRTRRALEMVVGVAVGIAIGDLLISAIGTGAPQIGLVVLLAMGTTTVLGGGPLIASQAASSAVLVATVRSSSGTLVPSRFVDALVGGAVGITVLAVAPRDPARMARRELNPVVNELAGSLDDIATALAARDLAAMNQALVRARGMETVVSRLHETLVLAEETTRIAPSYWRERGRISRYEASATQIELATRNVRVLARAGVRAVELEPRIPVQLPEAIRQLATAVRRLSQELDRGGEHAAIRDALLQAAVLGMGALEAPRGFAIDVVVGQVRSVATDLLRAIGLDQADAVTLLRTAVGEHEGEPPRSHPPNRSSRRPGTGRA